MSNSIAHDRAPKRQYRLGKRATAKEQTRQRIVEAAVELHSSLGPARTSIAHIAEKAGVQRHTFYAHFPDERSLSLACSGLAFERDPLPDIEQWAACSAGVERIRRGLGELYQWYSRNAEMIANVLRDAEYHELTREVAELRMRQPFERINQLLGEGLAQAGRALLHVALDFHCWRVLVRTGAADPAETMAAAIVGVREG
jgi:AcrR family transcriptional regulator